MKAPRGHAHTKGGSHLIGEVEGYLKAQLYYIEARAEAERLCAVMPWLTPAQAEEMTRHYVDQSLHRTRRTLVTQIDDLRAQYERRYQELRASLAKRYTVIVLMAVTGSVGANAGAWMLLR